MTGQRGSLIFSVRPVGEWKRFFSHKLRKKRWKFLFPFSPSNWETFTSHVRVWPCLTSCSIIVVVVVVAVVVGMFSPQAVPNWFLKKNTVFKPLSDRNSQFEKLSMLKCFFFLSSTCALEKKYGIILCALYRDILAYASRNNSKHGTNDLYVTRMTNGPLTVANLEKTRKLRNSSLPVISFLAKKNVRD